MNKYDDVRIDVSQLLNEQNSKLSDYDPDITSASDLRFYEKIILPHLRIGFMGFLIKTGIYKKLIYSHLNLRWFDEFREYWVTELGNRPIEPHDFHFLSGKYRQRFHQVAVKDDASGEEYLRAWRDYRNIHSLFSYQYKSALNPLRAYRYAKYIPRNSKVCEYGCGLAPITNSLCRFYAHRKLKITCADIPHLMLHFIRWKFRDKKYIRMVSIDPDDDSPLDDTYDVIFLLTVLEHLPRPIPIIQHLTDRIRGGILVFDYIKSEGHGLDTLQAVKDRISVLEFICNHFEVIDGRISLDGSSVGSTVCRKK